MSAINGISKQVSEPGVGDLAEGEEQHEEEADSLEEINIENLLGEIEENKKIVRFTRHVYGPSTSRNLSVKSQNVQKNHGPRLAAATQPSKEQTLKPILRKTLLMNLLTLAYLFILEPTQITIIIYKDCDDLLGKCDFLFKILSVSMTFQLVAAFVHPLVFCVYLNKLC